ncbi:MULTISPECIES: hypothetical protein [Bacillaceae]|uniref:hypothetical protein n=1 Tax=Bacillaceae TaxID=186817 RepID=UPI002FFD665D
MTGKQVGMNNQSQIGKYKQGSGSKYHEEHASHVPDYGANTVDPNAKMANTTDENNLG